MTKKNEKEVMVENQEFKADHEELQSSFELLWKLGFEELDAWVERLNYRDEVFLNSAKHYAERVKRNQENTKAVTDQFAKELREWEKGAREELLMSTTTLQHFLPIKSYEDINRVVDDFQKRTASLLLSPFQTLTGGQGLDKYMETVEEYISFRKNGRDKYIESVKQTSNVFFENQKIFVNLFSKQVKNTFFPFQKYMNKTTEPANS
jgi:hypothetical protein